MGKPAVARSPRITPHLWFDTEAKEAAAFYCSVFPHSQITHVSTIRGVPSPSGECDIVSFELSGQPFMAISAGPMFKFNEAISLLIPCETQEEVDYFWEKLSAGSQGSTRFADQVKKDFSRSNASEDCRICQDRESTFGSS